MCRPCDMGHRHALLGRMGAGLRGRGSRSYRELTKGIAGFGRIHVGRKACGHELTGSQRCLVHGLCMSDGAWCVRRRAGQRRRFLVRLGGPSGWA